jgi:hypothetical protein
VSKKYVLPPGSRVWRAALGISLRLVNAEWINDNKDLGSDRMEFVCAGHWLVYDFIPPPGDGTPGEAWCDGRLLPYQALKFFGHELRENGLMNEKVSWLPTVGYEEAHGRAQHWERLFRKKIGSTPPAVKTMEDIPDDIWQTFLTFLSLNEPLEEGW